MILVAATETQPTRTYGNWRRPTSSGILGLGSLGTALLLAGLILAVIVAMVSDIWRAAIVALIVGVLLLATTQKDSHGHNILSRAATRISWFSTRSAGKHLYRSGPLGRSLWGT